MWVTYIQGNVILQIPQHCERPKLFSRVNSRGRPPPGSLSCPKSWDTPENQAPFAHCEFDVTGLGTQLKLIGSISGLLLRRTDSAVSEWPSGKGPPSTPSPSSATACTQMSPPLALKFPDTHKNHKYEVFCLYVSPLRQVYLDVRKDNQGPIPT